MNSNPNKFEGVPEWIRSLLGDTSGIVITDADLDEAARIVQEGARAYRESVVVPFVRPQVEIAMSAVRLAAANAGVQDRYPVLLAENIGESGDVRYTPAGSADLNFIKEYGEGEVWADWTWRPEGSGCGFEGLVAVVVEIASGCECGRGCLTQTPDGWHIKVDRANMEALALVKGESHQIFLLG